jgi:hypothetical protein
VRKIGKAKKEPEVKRLNLNIPVELHNSFKSLTAARGERMTDVILQFIQEYVDRHSQKSKGRK